jgi:hypothetical protein
MRILFAAALASLPLPAQAATFEVLKTGDTIGIVVRGTINHGDEKVFQDRVRELQRLDTIVYFDSDGGNLYAGLVIGETIRKNGFATVVAWDDMCVSVCALAWMAGVKRGLYPTSQIGFHAAYNGKDGKVVPDGNALIGAYLTNLGYLYKTVMWVLKKGEEMQWLTPDNAAESGIDYELLKEEPPPPVPAPPHQQEPQPSRPPPGRAQAPYVCVTAEELNIRLGPSAWYPVGVAVARGTCFYVGTNGCQRARDGDTWCASTLRFAQGVGWFNSKFAVRAAAR